MRKLHSRVFWSGPFGLLTLLFDLFLLVACGPQTTAPVTSPSARLEYPVSFRDSSIRDEYFGTSIADAYRWLENDTSEQTAAWVQAQNRVTEGYLSSIAFRQNLRSRLERLYRYERFGVPDVVGDYLYFTRNDGQQNQSPLYREPLAGGGAAELVLDPNLLSSDQTTSLAGTSYSLDGKYLAYQTSESGSDWHKARILDLETLKPLNDQLSDLKFTGIAWFGKGFFYSRYPSGKSQQALSGRNTGHAVYYHQIGQSQAQDRLVYTDARRPERNVGSSVSDDERYLVLSASEGTSGNSIAIASLRNGSIGKIVDVVSTFDHDYRFVHGTGDSLYFWTNASAPNGRIVLLNAQAPNQGFRDVIPQDAKRPLKSATFSGQQIYLRYLDQVSSKIEVYSISGQKLKDLALPGLGTATDVSARAKGGPAYFGFSSFTSPGKVFRYDPSASQSTLWRASNNGFDESLYETKQVFYPSKDGTQIPMFIVHRKGLKLDSARPTLIYGYGGFDISIEPQHAVMRLDLVSPLLEQDGVVAVANLRGGGEFGEAWHEAGTKANKQNVFDDFIAAAEYLQTQGYTRPDRTAIYGRSNGGLLVGAVITQRPELFGVAFPAVGVLDMLRYHKFTIGWAWASDYGRADSADAFQYLRKYSPLHNLKPANYPSTMITTADHDDRVVPAHSFKFAAEMQRVQQSAKPILIRVDTKSGHAAGKPIGKQIEEATDVLAFLFHEMGIAYRAPGPQVPEAQ